MGETFGLHLMLDGYGCHPVKCCETLGKKHWRGAPRADDVELRESKVDRIYDVFAWESDFEWAGEYLRDFATGIRERVSFSLDGTLTTTINVVNLGIGAA